MIPLISFQNVQVRICEKRIRNGRQQCYWTPEHSSVTITDGPP